MLDPTSQAPNTDPTQKSQNTQHLSPGGKTFQDFLTEKSESKDKLEISPDLGNGMDLGKKPNSSPLMEKIQNESQKKGLDPDLVKAVIQTESNFNPNAVSPKGAKGLMQLMPSTAKMLGVKNPLDPMENIEGGTQYLADMMNSFRDQKLALAAYNAGPGSVKKFKGVPPYKETERYIEKIEKIMEESKTQPTKKSVNGYNL